MGADSGGPEPPKSADPIRSNSSMMGPLPADLRPTVQPAPKRPTHWFSVTPSQPRPPAPLLLRLRQAHAAVAPLVLLPLLLTVCTGVSYRLLRDWGGLGRDQAHVLMLLHEGEWLKQWFGPNGETLYVLLNGLGLLWMLLSGGALAVQRLQRQLNPRRG